MKIPCWSQEGEQDESQAKGIIPSFTDSNVITLK